MGNPIVLPLLGVLALARAKPQCAPEDKVVDGKCIFAVAEIDPKAAVAECASSCVSRGMLGSMLAPSSKAQDDAAHDLCVRGHHRFCYIGIAEVEPTASGGYKLADDGDWHKIEYNRLVKLEDGDYQNWCPGEPNNGGQDQKIAGYCGNEQDFDMSSYCADTVGCWHDVTPLPDCGAICGCDASGAGGGGATPPAPAPAPAAGGLEATCPALDADAAGTCFFLVPTPTFVEGHEACADGCAQRGLAGGLFVPTSARDDGAAVKKCQAFEYGFCRVGIAEAYTNERGGIEWGQDGTWHAVGGRGPSTTPLAYENWCPGEPNNAHDTDEKVAGYYGAGWTDAPCWFDVPNGGMTGKSAALCRCESDAAPWSAPDVIDADDGGSGAALTVGLVLGALLVLCAPLAFYGGLALYHGAKVPLPWRDMAWDPPAGGAGSVNFSPLHGGAPDYEPPGGM